MYSPHMACGQLANNSSVFRAGCSAHTSHTSLMGRVVVLLVRAHFPLLLPPLESRADARLEVSAEARGCGATKSDADDNADTTSTAGDGSVASDVAAFIFVSVLDMCFFASLSTPSAPHVRLSVVSRQVFDHIALLRVIHLRAAVIQQSTTAEHMRRVGPRRARTIVHTDPQPRHIELSSFVRLYRQHGGHRRRHATDARYSTRCRWRCLCQSHCNAGGSARSALARSSEI